METVFLGIDIAKRKFDVALFIGNKMKTRVFSNDQTGFEALASFIDSQKPCIHICMEATGRYYEALATFLHQRKFLVSVVNPAQIKSFGQSELTRTKTDKADAKLIARFCKALKPKAWHPTSPEIRLLQDWVRNLEALKKMLRQEKNRLETASDEVAFGIREHIEWLKKQIKTVENTVQQHLQANKNLERQRELLASIPGVGKATIAHVLAFMSNPEDYPSVRQVVAYAGLNPREHQSGTSVHKKARISKMGNRTLRAALYMPTLVAIRCNPLIRVFCERLLSKGKTKMVVIGAAMRKLVHLLYGVLKSGRPFDPNWNTAALQAYKSPHISIEGLHS